MTLKNKTAVIYGAGGSLGSSVAKAFASSGADVFLSGRNLEPVTKTMNEIIAEGRKAEAFQVDALNQKEVDRFLNAVLKKKEAIDISFNAIGFDDVQNIPLVEMSLHDFLRPIDISMRSSFITATSAARNMIKQGSGCIISLTATPGAIGYPLVGGFGPTCCAIESFCQNLACELGPHGVRVVNIRSAGSPDSRPFTEAMKNEKDATAGFVRKLEADTMLKKLPMMNDIANAAVFLCSDMASKITGTTIDVTCGTTSGINYRTASIPFK